MTCERHQMLKSKINEKMEVKRTWKKPVDEENVKVGLIREDALCRTNLIVSVN